MIILGSPKDYRKRIVSNLGEYIDGAYYEGIVDSRFIVGYIDLETLEFHPNENYEYGDDIFFGGRE